MTVPPPRRPHQPVRAALPDLRTRLLELAAADQAVRQEPPHTEAQLRALTVVDARNTRELQHVVGRHGWPGHHLVGVDGAEAAWLLAQHADREPAFQLRALGLLEKAVQRGDATVAQLAYLTDRTRLNAGIPQVFGTQWTIRDGAQVLWPVEEPDSLERRRAEAGLPPMAEYAARIRSGRLTTVGEDR